MSKSNKIQEAEVQLENREYYKPLGAPMVNTTQTKVELHRGKHIDDLTKKWLSQTSSPPRIPVFYTLTKIHKPILVRRPIISGCDRPTEKIPSFVDTLLQPIAQKQQSYVKDTTDFNKTQFEQQWIFLPYLTIIYRSGGKHPPLSPTLR